VARTASTHPLAAVCELPGVPGAVAAARESVDRLLAHRVLRRRSAEVSAEAALRGARASGVLEGVDLPLESYRSGAAFADPAGGHVAAAAVRVTAEVGSQLPVWERAPGQALARLHAVAAAGVSPEAELGRPVAGAARLQQLALVVTDRAPVPAIVLAAVVHAELAVLRPFSWGSGLVARAAERLVLAARGLDPKAVCAPEVGHAELVEGYADRLRGYASGDADGVGGWVVHCAQAVALGARDGLAVCEALTRRAAAH